jgi:6-phosphogluconolactonase (cycloisomerase 2 family)
MDMNMQFAKTLSGHDKGQTYMVIHDDGKYVYLVNGTTKKLSSPKKKNRKHIQIINVLPDDVRGAVSGEMTDLSIKRAIKLYNRKEQ